MRIDSYRNRRNAPEDVLVSTDVSLPIRPDEIFTGTTSQHLHALRVQVTRQASLIVKQLMLGSGRRPALKVSVIVVYEDKGVMTYTLTSPSWSSSKRRLVARSISSL